MPNFFTIIVIIASVFILHYFGRQIFYFIAYKGETVAKLDHTEEHIERDTNAKGSLRRYYTPIYEYEVDGTIYYSEAIRYKYDPDLFEIEGPCVVKYSLSDPRKCSIKGSECRFRYSREAEV